MKYQQNGIDPRYRDSRPFVNSSANLYEYSGRRDFFSRRRSSSSLQEDFLQPFNNALQQQQQQHVPQGILRKSKDSLTGSGGSLTTKTSRWDLTPSIFIEEYDEVKAAAEAAILQAEAARREADNASEQQNRRLPDESDDDEDDDEDEIPFIDDERAMQSDHSEPIYVPVEMAQREYRTNKTSPIIKNRKTVSFDLIERPAVDGDPIAPPRNWMQKSSTCGHIRDVHAGGRAMPTMFGKMVPTVAPPLSKPQILTNIYKDTNKSATTTESFKYDSDNDDSLSAYFCNDDDVDDDDDDSIVNDQCERRHLLQSSQTKPFDEKAVALDLSELLSSSDSSTTTTTTTTTTATASNPPLAQPEVSFLPHPDKAFDILIERERKRTAPPPAWIPLTFLDKLAFGHGKVEALRMYFETLRASPTVATRSGGPKILTQSSPDLRRKYSWNEQRTVMDQLRQWTEYGIQSPPQAAQKSVSTTNLCDENVLDDISVAVGSVPDIPRRLNEDRLHHSSFPELYRQMRNYHDGGIRQSNSPRVGASRLQNTLRRIKQNQMAKRISRIDGGGGGGRAASSGSFDVSVAEDAEEGR